MVWRKVSPSCPRMALTSSTIFFCMPYLSLRVQWAGESLWMVLYSNMMLANGCVSVLGWHVWRAKRGGCLGGVYDGLWVGCEGQSLFALHWDRMCPSPHCLGNGCTRYFCTVCNGHNLMQCNYVGDHMYTMWQCRRMKPNLIESPLTCYGRHLTIHSSIPCMYRHEKMASSHRVSVLRVDESHENTFVMISTFDTSLHWIVQKSLWGWVRTPYKNIGL